VVGAAVQGSYRVIYGDTDQMGVVYYANYLVFFERGRCDFMRARGFDYAGLEREGSFLPVVDAAVKYVKPARFDDLLTIETTLEELGRSSLRFTYRVLRGEELLCTGHTRHACVNREGRPVRLPAAVVALA
jgi:acyl-CoA thioester hydrolase